MLLNFEACVVDGLNEVVEVFELVKGFEVDVGRGLKDDDSHDRFVDQAEFIREKSEIAFKTIIGANELVTVLLEVVGEQNHFEEKEVGGEFVEFDD